MFHPATGDVVIIEDVLSGSRNVIGMTGTVRSTHSPYGNTPERIVVETPTFDVIATKVRPA